MCSDYMYVYLGKSCLGSEIKSRALPMKILYRADSSDIAINETTLKNTHVYKHLYF